MSECFTWQGISNTGVTLSVLFNWNKEINFELDCYAVLFPVGWTV